MRSVDNLTSNANQLINFVLEDNSVVVLNLIFQAATQRWIINVLRGTFVVNNINVCIHPNFFREWRNTQPFGLACFTTDGADPVNIDDFSNGRATLYVLNPVDVALFEATVFGAGIP